MSAILELTSSRPTKGLSMDSRVDAFSDKAENYLKYRAGYPDSLLDFLASECGLTAESVVADLGSGTGTLTRMLLGHVNSVYAVEPNPDMRAVAERLFSTNDGFKSIDATAEATTLPDRSVDFVTAGRALQWFDVSATLAETSRILRPQGWAVFVWNRRKQPETDFNLAYKEFLTSFCGNFREQMERRRIAREYLDRSGYRFNAIDFQHQVNLQQLKGLVLSLSISPNEGDPDFESMVKRIEEMFATHQVNGHVTFDYSTLVYAKRFLINRDCGS
ncbi:methyltransferase domain-containing protein [Gammaproteobacteria bacterium]|jgi:ubiquinone/menaquinone biosynthesis C-methylase UbiE|nr:methyltransferase domain-containing protein [Gammaproteobacteria bacterium]